jgi:amidohydrolase
MLDSETWESMPGRFERIVKGVCDAHRATCEIAYDRVAPVVENDPELTAFATESLSRSLGSNHVLEAPAIMAAEDFAEFQQKIPGVFFFLGVGNEAEGWTDYVHTPTFRPDEAALAAGVRAVSNLLVDATSR